MSHFVTKDYSDLTGFQRKEGISVYSQFVENFGRGFFRPDLMPNCTFKSDWFKFFQDLTRRYQNNFKSVNASVYSSLHFFQMKQKNNIEIVKIQGKK